MVYFGSPKSVEPKKTEKYTASAHCHAFDI